MTLTAPVAPSTDFSAKERMELIERVAASSGLRRSQRLRDFLLYVGREAVEQGTVELPEQRIGESVFGRPHAYDTTADNIVRVTATELRKRIETYFTTEGAAETLVVEIPRGSYLPVFRRRTLELAVEPLLAEPPERAAVMPIAAPAKAGVVWPWQLAVVLLLIALGAFAGKNMQLTRELAPWKQGPALRALWAPFLGNNAATDLLLADTSFALAEDIVGRQIPLGDYVSSAYQELADTPGLSETRKADLRLILERNNGSFGDFEVAQQILRLDPASPALRMHFARDYTPDSLKRSNVVLVGSRKSNPWVDLFEGQLNFVLGYNPASRTSYVENLHPQPGEQARYDGQMDSSMGDGYSVIAVLPGLTAGRHVLILEGTGSQATNSAGDFVTTEASLETLRTLLGGRLPAAFEVLLRTAHLRGTPLQSSIVAVRIHSN